MPLTTNTQDITISGSCGTVRIESTGERGGLFRNSMRNDLIQLY